MRYTGTRLIEAGRTLVRTGDLVHSLLAFSRTAFGEVAERAEVEVEALSLGFDRALILGFVLGEFIYFCRPGAVVLDDIRSTSGPWRLQGRGEMEGRFSRRCGGSLMLESRTPLRRAGRGRDRYPEERRFLLGAPGIRDGRVRKGA